MPTRTYEVRQRAFTYQPSSLVRDYQEEYAYVQERRETVVNGQGDGVEWCGEIPDKHEIVWYRRFWITRPDGIPSVIHYLKPYAYNAALFRKNPSLAAPGPIFVSPNPERGRSLASDPLTSPPVNPTHLDIDRILPQIMGEQARAQAQHALKKVRKFVESLKGKESPQTSTVFQWYELEEFEASRHLGYLMAWAYLSMLEFSDEELQPNVSCRAL